MSTTCLKRSVLVPVAKLASSSPVFLSSGNMAYLAPIVLCLVLAVETHAQGYYGGGYGYGRPEECTDVTRPCRMSLSLESDFGEPTLSSAHLCSCSHPSRCPTDLTQTDYVVSRRLVSSTYTTTLNMMFCNPVQPDRVCEGGETSVVLSGYLAIPDQLEVFNCSCEDGVPLQLNRRWRTANFKYMHEYVCDNQKPTCTMSFLPCVIVELFESRHMCKCPGRTLCHVPSVTEEAQTVTPQFGFCRAPTPPGKY